MNPTRALVLKDLRLSLDALLPWVLIVVGITIIGVILRATPASMPWADLHDFRLAELLVLLGWLVGGSAAIVTAWSTGVILHGDRTHGAWMLTRSVPVPGSSRVLGKSVAILGAALVPVVTGVLLGAAGALLQGRSLLHASDFLSFAWFTLLGAIVTTGLMLAAGSFTTTIRTTLAWGLVLAILAGAAGALGHPLGADRALADYYTALAPNPRESAWWKHHHDRIQEILGMGLVAAIVGGAVIAAIVGAGIGLWSIARHRRLRVIVAGYAMMMLAAVAGGAVFSWFTIERAFARHPDHITDAVKRIRLPDEALVAAIEGYRTSDDRSAGAFAMEAGRRVRSAPESERATHPLARTLLAARDFSTAERAMTTLYWPVESDEERLSAAFDAALRHPESPSLRFALWSLLIASQSASAGGTRCGGGPGTLGWPLIAELSRRASGAVDEPEFGSPLWAVRLRERRLDALVTELVHLRRADASTDPSRDARIEAIQHEHQRMRAVRQNFRAVDRAREQELMLRLKVMAESDGAFAERASKLLERFEKLSVGGWGAPSGLKR